MIDIRMCICCIITFCEMGERSSREQADINELDKVK